MATDFPRNFGPLTSPVPLSYLDDNFAQLQAASTSTVSLAGAALIGYMPSGSVQSFSVQEYLRLNKFILGWIPANLWAGILNRTGTTDLSTYIAAAYAAHSTIRWPSGRYYVESSIDLTSIYGAGLIGDSWSDGVADDWNQTEIVINATNTPGLRVQGSVRLENFIIGYAAQQTTSNTSSRTIEFNNIAQGVVRNIKAKYGYDNFAIKQAAFGATSYNILFSSHLDQLYSFSASNAHYDLRNFSGGGTNVEIGTLYINGGGSADFGTAGQSANYGIRGQNWNGYELGAVSVDALEIVEQVLDASSSHFTVDTFRMEAVTFKNDNDGWILLGGSDSTALFNLVNLKNCRGLLADVPNATYIFRVSATKSFTDVGVIRVDSDCTFTSAVNRLLTFGSTTSESEFHLHDVNNAASGMSSTSWTDGSSLAVSPIRTWNSSAVSLTRKQGNTTTVVTEDNGTAPPASGTFTLGHYRRNTTPTAGRFHGWQNISAGSPGTFAGVGGIPLINTTGVGNVGTGEDNLQTVSLPAAMLHAAGSGLRITAWGTYANNGDAKTLKLYFGATAISTQSLTTSQAGTWEFEAVVFSTGTDAQDYKVRFFQEGTTEQNDLDIGTATEDDGAAITIKCTGEATSNNDIVQEGLLVEPLR